MKLREESGFTIIELLAVITITGLTALIGYMQVPAMLKFMRRNEAREMIESDIMRLRGEALKRGGRGVITIATDGKSYTVGYDEFPYNLPVASDSVIYPRPLPNGVTLVVPESKIIFDSSGYMINTSLAYVTKSVVLKDNNVTYYTNTIFPLGSLEY